MLRRKRARAFRHLEAIEQAVAHLECNLMPFPFHNMDTSLFHHLCLVDIFIYFSIAYICVFGIVLMKVFMDYSAGAALNVPV